jgi:hypothetical protein
MEKKKKWSKNQNGAWHGVCMETRAERVRPGLLWRMGALRDPSHFSKATWMARFTLDRHLAAGLVFEIVL